MSKSAKNEMKKNSYIKFEMEIYNYKGAITSYTYINGK